MKAHISFMKEDMQMPLIKRLAFILVGIVVLLLVSYAVFTGRRLTA